MNAVLPAPDLDAYPPIEWRQLRWLLDQGVPITVLMEFLPLRVARGIVGPNCRLDEDPMGKQFIVFEELEDVLYWRPRSGELASWNGRAFALGEAAIDDPATCAFGGHLNLWPDPLSWLRAKCDGCVILDWSRAWFRLHDVPRIAVHELLLFQYRHHMKPPPGPETFVLRDASSRSAAS
ncbi:MAG: hypothetical protein RIB97_00960 [Nitratireductor sp.]